MASTTPSALLADSLASLSRSAYQAFAQVESQARSEVARAVSDAQDARNERDKAVEALHKTQLEAQAWKQEVNNYKASLKQTEISIAHQAETVAQLRREANQWKDQSRNWQEHFLRVEQERCALSSRVDELVAERLQWSRPLDAPAPLTPQYQFSKAIDSAPSSTTTKRASTSSFDIRPSSGSARRASPPQLDSPLTVISTHKSTRLQAKPAKLSKSKPPPDVPLPDVASKPLQNTSQKISARSPKRTEPRQTVIRRVQAIIHVKQEDDTVNIDPEEEEVRLTGKRSSPRKRRKTVPHDDDDYAEEDGNQNSIENTREEPDNNSSDEGVGSDDEDELTLGAEDNHHEVYGTQRVKTMKILPATAASIANKKRKTAESGVDKRPPATVRRKI